MAAQGEPQIEADRRLSAGPLTSSFEAELEHVSAARTSDLCTALHSGDKVPHPIVALGSAYTNCRKSYSPFNRADECATSLAKDIALVPTLWIRPFADA